MNLEEALQNTQSLLTNTIEQSTMGEIIAGMVTFQDITETLKAEQALRESMG